MDFQGFVESLGFMGIGMASIIIVIGVLVIAVLLLNLFTSDKIKKSRKIIFVTALAVVLVGVSLLNGIRMNSAVEKYVEENQENIIAAFNDTFGTGELESTIEVKERSFIITFKDVNTESVSDETKAIIQKNFESYESLFEEILSDFKKDVKELKSYEFKVCDKNGEDYLKITADGK